jgi:hypothetical protein
MTANPPGWEKNKKAVGACQLEPDKPGKKCTGPLQLDKKVTE